MLVASLGHCVTPTVAVPRRRSSRARPRFSYIIAYRGGYLLRKGSRSSAWPASGTVIRTGAGALLRRRRLPMSFAFLTLGMGRRESVPLFVLPARWRRRSRHVGAHFHRGSAGAPSPVAR